MMKKIFKELKKNQAQGKKLSEDAEKILVEELSKRKKKKDDCGSFVVVDGDKQTILACGEYGTDDWVEPKLVVQLDSYCDINTSNSIVIIV